MKKILFVYTKMIVGGSTTSLLSLLNSLDNTKEYEIDLLLLKNDGVLQNCIPSWVNVLIPAQESNQFKNVLRKLFSLKFIFDYLKSRVLSKKYSSPLIKAQIMSKYMAKNSRKLSKTYDTAVSFLEFWPCKYVAEYVNATKKITWLHIDYLGAGLLSKLDDNTFGMFDKIVLVSNECVANFRKKFPHYSDKIICIKNILSQETIKALAYSYISEIEMNGSLKLISVCRIVFSHKGLDRGVLAFNKLKKEGILDADIKWYIIGDGPDKSKLENMIVSFNLENNIMLLGQKINPHIYVKHTDVFFLPSRYEGMPMAVTEALMLGVVPFVTNYASSSDQINNGYDGIIIENDDESIYKGLKNLIMGKYNIDSLKKNVLATNYSNSDEINKIFSIL